MPTSPVNDLSAHRRALEQSNHPQVAHALELWDLFTSAAGDLENCERQLIDYLFARSERAAYLIRVRAGHVSILMRVIAQLANTVDGSWQGLFAAALARGASVDEDHEHSIPGTLYGLGLAVQDFDALMDIVRAQPFYPDRFGRRRRLEVALLAKHHIARNSRARAFLFAEAQRFAQQFSSTQVDTAAAALYFILEHEHPDRAAIFNPMMKTARFNEHNRETALGLATQSGARRDRDVAPGILYALDNQLGHHRDGERTQLIRAYAQCAGTDAISVLQSRLSPQATQAAQTSAHAAEQAALLAGVVEADPASPRWPPRVRACMQAATRPDAELDHSHLDASVALLQTLFEHDVVAHLGDGDTIDTIIDALRRRATLLALADSPLHRWLTDVAEARHCLE